MLQPTPRRVTTIPHWRQVVTQNLDMFFAQYNLKQNSFPPEKRVIYCRLTCLLSETVLRDKLCNTTNIVFDCHCRSWFSRQTHHTGALVSYVYNATDSGTPVAALVSHTNMFILMSVISRAQHKLLTPWWYLWKDPVRDCYFYKTRHAFFLKFPGICLPQPFLFRKIIDTSMRIYLGSASSPFSSKTLKLMFSFNMWC